MDPSFILFIQWPNISRSLREIKILAFLEKPGLYGEGLVNFTPVLTCTGKVPSIKTNKSSKEKKVHVWVPVPVVYYTRNRATLQIHIIFSVKYLDFRFF